MTDARLLADLHAAAEAVWQDVVPLCPGFAVEVLPRIASTNTELVRRARAGALAPLLLVAAEQAAGRGRMGRVWHSAAGASLTFSLGLPLRPEAWSGLSLAAGLALAEALHPRVQIKWPNDLVWQQRKLGGVLIETLNQGAHSYAVIGVGLNLLPPACDAALAAAAADAGTAADAAAGADAAALALVGTPPPGTTTLAAAPPALAPTCLHALDPDLARSPGHWLRCLGPALLRQALDFEAQGFAPLRARFAARDALVGCAVQLSDGRVGQADGVRADGALWLRCTNAQGQPARVAVWQPEVSVRPC